MHVSFAFYCLLTFLLPLYSRLNICTGINWEIKFLFVSADLLEPSYLLASKLCQLYEVMPSNVCRPMKPYLNHLELVK